MATMILITHRIYNCMDEDKRNTLPKIPSLKQAPPPKYDSPFAIPDDAEVLLLTRRYSV